MNDSQTNCLDLIAIYGRKRHIIKQALTEVEQDLDVLEHVGTDADTCLRMIIEGIDEAVSILGHIVVGDQPVTQWVIDECVKHKLL